MQPVQTDQKIRERGLNADSVRAEFLAHANESNFTPIWSR